MCTTWFRRKWKVLRNGFRSKPGERNSSQNQDSRKPTPPTTPIPRVETPEAGPDQEIIQKHPWTIYTSASPSEKKEIELALLVEVAKSSNQSPGDHGPMVNHKVCSDLLRDNQEFRAIFLRCWEKGSFQDLRSNDAFPSTRPLNSQALAVDVGDGKNRLSENNRTGKRRENIRSNSTKAGGQTLNFQNAKIRCGGDIQFNVTQSSHSDNSESKIPKWLSSLDHSETHNGLRRKRTHGTGTWFLHSEEFKSWIESSDSNVLWCPGIPGAGKTMIASLVIDHLRDSTEGTAITFIYFTYKLHGQQSLIASVESLSRQVDEICRSMKIPSEFDEVYQDHQKNKTKPSVDELLDALQTTLRHFKQVYVILDALDEYLKDCSDAEIRELLTTVKSFGDHIKILATSRNIGKMENLFEDLNAVKKEISADSRDLEAFVKAGFDVKKIDRFHVSAELLQEVIQKVEEAADGRFLMAELHMSTLAAQPTRGNLKDSLKILSTKVDETYALAMDRIERSGDGLKELAKKTLMWIACARRPMTVGELQHALATEHSRENIDDYIPLPPTITSACAGLVVIENEKMAFVHLTTQEFFDEHQARYFPDAHKTIGRTCLDYILLPCFLDLASNHLPNFQHTKSWKEDNDFCNQFMNDLRQNHPFYEYAALSWGFHANRHGADEALAGSILVALKRVDDRLKLALIHTLGDMSVDSAGLFLALYHRQKDAFLALIDKTYIPTTKRQHTPFIIAACLGLPDFIELMVQTWGADDSHPKQIPGNSQLPHTEEPDNTRVHVASPNDAGYTPLWYAVHERHTAVVKLLLQYPATQVNTVDNESCTPLILAATMGFDDITELLLKCPMLDVNLQTTNGKTALRIAAGSGFHNVVKLLLEHPVIDVNLADDDGVSPFLAASMSGDTSTLTLLLDYRKPSQPVDSLHDTVGPLTVDIYARDTYGKSALATAARVGSMQAVDLLLRYTDIGADMRSNRGYTPLTYASNSGHADIVRLLLDRASVNINNIDDDGDTPLICAVYNGHASVAKVLLDQPGIQVNVQDRMGRTALSRACDRAMTPNEDGKEKTEAEACSFVTLLLEHKDIDISLADEEGKTPLYYATRSGFQEVITLMQGRGAVYDDTTTELLVKWVMKLDINSQDTDGKTALRIAAETGCHTMVKLLLEHPAIDVNLADDDGVSPFLAASERGDTSTLKLLLDYRKPSQPLDPLQDTVGRLTVDVHARNKWGRSALALAAWNGRLPAIELLLDRTDIDPDLRSSHGGNPLAMASEKGHADIVQLLLDRAQVNINNIDNDGDTPLICAAYNGHASVAKVLLDQPGIRVNVQDGRGRTALSRACDAAKVIQSNKKTEAEAYSFAALLLEHKDIDANLADGQGRTPLYYASRSSFHKVIELMQGRGAFMSSEATDEPT